ncbi:MAG TPA: hypothetical protein PLZ51_21660 [Aggregatilineales bacterium]|nr:hypothetical protein [Aggregatilineales bacterium]
MLDDLKFLLREYISRQQLVYEAIQELRPDFFIVHDKSISNEDVLKVVRQYQKVPFRGTWQKYGTWEYYIHGIGCRLTNLVSGEIIEWDIPHITHFERLWFMNWVNWVRKANHTYQSLSEEVVYDLFNQLEQDGVIERIHPDNNFKLRFVDKQ